MGVTTASCGARQRQAVVARRRLAMGVATASCGRGAAAGATRGDGGRASARR